MVKMVNFVLYLCILPQKKSLKIKYVVALTSVAQLVGHHPAKGKFTGSIPGQGTWLGCGFCPFLGHV